MGPGLDSLAWTCLPEADVGSKIEIPSRRCMLLGLALQCHQLKLISKLRPVYLHPGPTPQAPRCTHSHTEITQGPNKYVLWHGLPCRYLMWQCTQWAAMGGRCYGDKLGQAFKQPYEVPTLLTGHCLTRLLNRYLTNTLLYLLSI